MKKLVFLSVILIIVVAGCKKDNAPAGNSNIPLNFVSLQAESDTVIVDAYVNITANATGENLSFIWSAPQGTILGSGKTIKFTICHATQTQVECTVKDAAGHQDKKSVNIISK